MTTHGARNNGNRYRSTAAKTGEYAFRSPIANGDGYATRAKNERRLRTHAGPAPGARELSHLLFAYSALRSSTAGAETGGENEAR